MADEEKAAGHSPAGKQSFEFNLSVLGYLLLGCVSKGK